MSLDYPIIDPQIRAEEEYEGWFAKHLGHDYTEDDPAAWQQQEEEEEQLIEERERIDRIKTDIKILEKKLNRLNYQTDGYQASSDVLSQIAKLEDILDQ